MKHFVFSWYDSEYERNEIKYKFWLTPSRWILERVVIPIMRMFGCQFFMLERGNYRSSYWPKGHTRPRTGFVVNDFSRDIFDGSVPVNSVSWLEPRYEEDKGYLIEEQRTNLLRKRI